MTVRDSFAYLEPLGYKPKFKRDGDWYARVTYQNWAGDTIMIAACPQRSECDVELTHRENDSVSLRELEQVFPDQRGPRQKYSIFDTAADPHILQIFVSTLAEQLRPVATPLIENSSAWGRVAEWRHREELGDQVAELELEISEAFKEERWNDVIAFARVLGPAISQVDQKRLEIAQKRLRDK
ncbi:MAG TPA: hypothetical protein VHR66_26260 [Gemmataceae bacterium]|jgi:hypothetical protein|nr:hypothetical protein [Gemmataceae bacterium]